MCLYTARNILLCLNAAVCFESQPHTFHEAMVVVALALKDGLVLGLHIRGMRLVRGEFVDKFLDFWACLRVLYHLSMVC